MAKKEYRSAVRSRHLITDALAELLTQKPLDKITVTDVVKLADINRGTFYAHYRDIPDVIHYLVQEMVSRIQIEALDTHTELSTVPHTLLNSVRHLLESEMDFFTKIMTTNDYAIVEEQIVQLIMDYFLQHESQFSTMEHEQYIMTIRFCAGGLSNLYHDWFLGKIPLTLPQLTDQAEKVLYKIIGQETEH